MPDGGHCLYPPHTTAGFEGENYVDTIATAATPLIQDAVTFY